MAKKTNKAVIMPKPDRQWEIDDAVRTLQRAQSIQKDKFLMSGVKKAAQDLNKMLYGRSAKPTKKK
jgi:hypothetical protein